MCFKRNTVFLVLPLEKYAKILRWVVFAAALLLIVTTCNKMIKSKLSKGDLNVYLYASNLIVRQENIYETPNRDLDKGGSYYLYLPLFAISLVPLTLLPIEANIVLWTIFNVFLVFWTVKMFYEAMTGEGFFEIPLPERWTIAFFSILLTLRFILYHLAYGQANLLILALLVLGLKLWSKKRETGAGAVIGLAIVLKVIAAPFIFWFVARRNLKTVFGIALGIFAGAFLIPWLVLGFEKTLEYNNYWLNNMALSDDLIVSKVPLVINVSPQALLYRLFTDVKAFDYRGEPVFLTVYQLPAQTIRILAHLIQGIIAATIVVYAVKYRRAPEIISKWGGAALTFAAIPLFAPTSQKHYFVVLLPAYLYVVYVWRSLELKDKWFRRLIVASFAVASMTVDGIVGDTLDNLFTVTGFIALGTVFLIAAIFRAAHCLKNSTAQFRATAKL